MTLTGATIIIVNFTITKCILSSWYYSCTCIVKFNSSIVDENLQVLESINKVCSAMYSWKYSLFCFRLHQYVFLEKNINLYPGEREKKNNEKLSSKNGKQHTVLMCIKA
jgi:hypothetical protein